VKSEGAVLVAVKSVLSSGARPQYSCRPPSTPRGAAAPPNPKKGQSLQVCTLPSKMRNFEANETRKRECLRARLRSLHLNSCPVLRNKITRQMHAQQALDDALDNLGQPAWYASPPRSLCCPIPSILGKFKGNLLKKTQKTKFPKWEETKTSSGQIALVASQHLSSIACKLRGKLSCARFLCNLFGNEICAM